MKKYFLILIAISIAFSLIAKDPNGSFERRDLNPAPSNDIPELTRDLWDNLLQFDIDTPTGQSGLAGVEWDGEYFYATKWSGSNQIYQFDSEGNYIGAITVPLTGARDLAFDGEYMYGSAASSEIYCWESETGEEIPENNITVTGQLVRALAYDPLTDTFWSGNWGNPVVNWNRDGNVINILDFGTDLYGLAFDPDDPEGPFLYAHQQTPGCILQRIDPETGEILESTDVTGQGGNDAIAGGLCYMNDWDPATRTLAALLQGTPDYICVYELGENAPAGAPAAPDMFTITPDAGGALSADLGWMNPTETVVGDALTDLDEMRVYRNYELIHTITNPGIGGMETWTDTPAAAGNYAYSVLGFNDEGEGIPASGFAYIGEDVPAAVTGISVANIDGDAVIIWVNPTTGLHGGPFNQPIQGYHISRDDGENFEVTGIITTWTDDTIPSDGLYAYTITVYNSIGDGGSASSVPTWIGSSQAAMFGDINTTTTHLFTPMFFWYGNSLSQTIYYADEFAAQGFSSGAITAIMYYNNFFQDLSNIPVNIWMQNTDLENLSGGWQSATDMIQVFEGSLDFPIGENEILIELDEPFIYEGGNLIIFVERVMDPINHGAYNTFYYTDTAYNDRCLWVQSDIEDFDPYAPPARYNVLHSNPNTMMFMNTTGLGSLDGYAYDTSTNEGLEGVDINVFESETRLHTVTAANGYYHFPGLFEGDYEATATKIAYSEDIQTFTIVADETLNIDFNLTPVEGVTVSGRIVGSDYPNIGLANATVTLSGIGVHEGITDANGEFSIDGVYALNTYELVINVEGYDIFIGEAEIGAANTDLGELIVNEITIPPYDAYVEENHSGNAYITWHSSSSALGSFRDIDDVRIDDPDDRSISLSPASKIGQQTNRDNRAFEGYAIFRGFADDEDNFEDWDLVVDSVQDTTYEDESWQEITEPGIYEYCVRAMYTNGVLSAPAFTNEIGFDMYAPVTFYVTTDSGDSADGAAVVFTSTDGEYIYEGTVSGGMIHWDEVWKTSYDLSIELEGYEDYQQTDIYVTCALTLNVELLELINPPANLAVDESTGMMTWTEPGTGGASIDNTVLEYALASFANYSNRTRHLDYYKVYIDYNLEGQTTDLEFNLAGLEIFENGVDYEAGVSAHFTSGNESEIITIGFTCNWVGSDAEQDVILGANALGDNYPNPFNPTTNFSYSVKEEALVNIEIYNVKGQKVRTLVNEVQDYGIYRVTWNGETDNGNKVSSGIYFYKINTGDFTTTKKMILMK